MRTGSAWHRTAWATGPDAWLGLMAEGRSNAALGARMGIGAKTVETHVGAIFSKLGLEPAADDNRRVLAVLAVLAYLAQSVEVPSPD